MNNRRTTGALGGTFDHFHRGHEHFLQFASNQAEQILIGVTNQTLITEKELSSIVEPYEVRTSAVRKYCEENGINFEIVELTDPFGPTLGQREVDCLIVTELTEHGGELLNKKRSELGLPILPVHVCSMLRDDSGDILNSTRIRQGLVSREGHVYYRLFDANRTLTLEQKEFFKTPLGAIVSRPEGIGTITAVVGDVCLANFRNNNWPYQLGVFDKLSQRQPFTEGSVLQITPDLTVSNPAGTIQSETVQKLRELMQSFNVLGMSTSKHVFVDGEEDLLTAVLVLLLPLYSHIYYGQPGVGMVKVVVNEELKERIIQVLSPKS